MFLLIQLLSITLFSLFIFYIIGRLIIYLLRIQALESLFLVFLSLLSGLIYVVSIYAIICTKGRTIQVFIIIVLSIILFLIRKSKSLSCYKEYKLKEIFRINYKFLSLLVVLCTAIFSVQYLILYDPSSSYLQTPFQDYVYYSRLTLPLNNLGIETNTIEVVFPQFVTEQPYHYLELWLNALIVRVTNLPSVWLYFVSSSSIMMTIICVGFMAIFSHFQIKYKWIPIFAFTFLFISGMRWSFLQQYSFVLNGALLSSLILCLNPKFTPVYLFLLFGAILLLKKDYIAASLVIASVPLAYISTTPVIGMSLGMMAMYLFIKKSLSFGQCFFIIFPIVLVSLAIILFYTLQPEAYQFPDTGRAFALKSIIPKINEIKTIVNITMGVFLNYGIYFISYIFVMVIALYISHQKVSDLKVPQIIWVWFGSSLTFAAAMRAFGTHYLDSFQFFSNIMVPLTPIILAIAIASILQKSTTKVYNVVFVLLLILSVVNLLSVESGNTRYSPSFMRKVEKVSQQLGSRGCYILADEDYKNAYMLSPDSYTTGNYISNFKNNYAFISLSALDPDSLTTDPRFKRDSAQAEQIVRKSTLYKFAKFQALKNRKISLDSIKYEFVKQNDIGFICVSRKAVLPLILQHLVQEKYTDSLSGEKLYVLCPDLRKYSYYK